MNNIFVLIFNTPINKLTIEIKPFFFHLYDLFASYHEFVLLTEEFKRTLNEGNS